MLTGRAVAPGQPQWLQSDTDLAVALMVLESERCSGCGHPRVDTFAPESEGLWVAEPLRCHSCAARDREARDTDRMDTAGLHWTTRRVDQR